MSVRRQVGAGKCAQNGALIKKRCLSRNVMFFFYFFWPCLDAPTFDRSSTIVG